MTLEEYRTVIQFLRAKQDITKEVANQIWAECKDQINDTELNLIKENINDEPFHEAVYGFITRRNEADSQQEKVENYIKPEFKAPEVETPPKTFCCKSGIVFAREKKTKALYIFRCDCWFGAQVKTSIPTWHNQSDYEKDL